VKSTTAKSGGGQVKPAKPKKAEKPRKGKEDKKGKGK
jgi:hypothetical protein